MDCRAYDRNDGAISRLYNSISIPSTVLSRYSSIIEPIHPYSPDNIPDYYLFLPEAAYISQQV